MNQSFTPNHILLAAYGELPTSTAKALHIEMEQNEVAANELLTFIDLQETLDNLRVKPSPTSIQIIMDYSRSSSLTESMV